MELNATLKPENDGRIIGKTGLITPWRHLGIDAVQTETEVKISKELGSLRATYDFSLLQGQTICSWSYVPLEDMQVSLESSSKKVEFEPKSLKLALKYTNPGKNKQKLSVGALFDVNSKWRLESNASLKLKSNRDIGFGVSVQLPAPIGDVHRFTGHYLGNLSPASMNLLDNLRQPGLDVNFEAKYTTDDSKRVLSTRALYRNVSDLQGLLQAEWGDNSKKDAFLTNVQMLRKGIRREFSTIIETPFHKEQTLEERGSYDRSEPYHLVT